MNFSRRRMLAGSAAALALPAASVTRDVAAAAAPDRPASGIDARRLGVQASRNEDQTRTLQRAIDQATEADLPLLLGSGTYRAGGLQLRSGAQLIGTRGATRLALTRGDALLSARAADNVTLSGLVIDGGGAAQPTERGLVVIEGGRALRIADCEIVNSSRQGLVLESVEGEIRANTIADMADAGLFSRDARGLAISGNTVRRCGNNGILVWRSQPGADGTLITGNRIEAIAARSGGSGQNGNAINVFRAGNVIVSNNRIDDAAFSAVRGNAASNLQVTGNNCSRCGEVAIYAEFGFQGAVIANNTVDGAAIGVVVTNFNEGGRLAVVQGNLIRNLVPMRPAGTDPGDGAGIGIGVEADTAVTGNVIENAPTAGIMLGWERHLRDVSVTGNVVRSAGVGIAVSVSDGAGSAVIANNLIGDTKRGAIVGMDGHQAVTGDLSREGASRYAQLAISGNRVR